MNWLLIILLVFPDGRQTRTEAGLMASEDICELAGNAIGARIEGETPEIEVLFACAMEI